MLLCTISGAINVTGQWRRRAIKKYKMLGEPDITNWIKTDRLRWDGHVARMSGEDSAKRLLDEKQDHTRRTRKSRSQKKK